MKTIPLLLVVLSILMVTTFCAESIMKFENTPTSRVRPYAENSYYWEYKGKPIVLLGGSKDDNLFQVSNLEEHLDLLASVGGNYVRNTMSSGDEGNVSPFARRADGSYDLEQINDSYFERLETLLRLAAERDIVVQIELWDRFDFARDLWQQNAYRPANNVNYTSENSGLADEYRRHPNLNDNPFFRSIPTHDNNAILLKYQRAQIDHLLLISLKYPNVLYCMDNETSATAEWGAYWSDYIKRKAAEAGKEVETTEMWDTWDLEHEQHRRTFDHPEIYSYIDISQNNHQVDQGHWDKLQWARDYVATQPRPLNHVKIYGADGGRFGDEKEAIERFWRSLLGGGAAMRFHRPPSGIGLSEQAQNHLRSARMLLSEFDIFRAIPDVGGGILAERSDNEAYLSYVAGEQYAVYFPSQGTAKLKLGTVTGTFGVNWLDIEHSEWQTAPRIEGGGQIALETPSPASWVVLILRTQEGNQGS